MAIPPEFQIQPLGPHHNRADFSCGVEPLDNYLKRQAGQDVKRRVSAAYVLSPDGRTIAGYYTLSQFSVDLGAIPQHIAKKLPRYSMVPATLIGRLAVSIAFRGRGLGEMLLMDALHRSLVLSEQAASAAVIVDAINDQARRFYLKYGFLELPGISGRLFLPMKSIEQLFQ
jgi:ribosomal protein S18 acetylase RimI-like enzyme